MPLSRWLALASTLFPLSLSACSDGGPTAVGGSGELALGFFDYSLTDPRQGGPVYSGTMQVTLLRADSMAVAWNVPGLKVGMVAGSGGGRNGTYGPWAHLQTGETVRHVIGKNLSCSATLMLVTNGLSDPRAAACSVRARP